MTNLPQINKEKIAERIQDIKEATSKLEQYRTMTLNKFEKDRDNFPLASYWLRIAIEAVLTIGTHILSRLPSNGKDKDYTEVILLYRKFNKIEFPIQRKGGGETWISPWG